MNDSLIIRGAREHNLKGVSLDLPRDEMIVFTGLSGSGKSSLAFDTIFAEGQRRYVESLSSYARQFLGQMDKPDVDFIEGLSPAVSIDQKSTNRNPRSTVGTITEVHDYLRLLYARAGRPHCPRCGEPITRQTPQQIVDLLVRLPERTRFQVLAPVVRARKGEYVDLFAELLSSGYSRARVDGEVVSLSAPPTLEKQVKHTIDVVVDRLVAKGEDPSAKRRLTDSVETALRLADGIAVVELVDLAIATGRATFSITAPGRPAIPDIGLTWLLPRAVGSQRALSLALVDETIDAERAHQWGLVAQVVDADEFAEHAQELVGRIGGEHAWATNQTRRLMRRTWETSRQETTESEAATLARALMRAR